MLFASGNKMSPFKNGGKMSSVFRDGEMIYKSGPKIVDFATGTDEEIAAMLDAHYKGQININDYWNVGDTRVMHLNAMAAGTGGEVHVEQNMTMVIIGIEHDDLTTAINGKAKAAITLQCREFLGNNGVAENGQNYGDTGQYADNPRRTWLNNTFIGALPTTIQSLVKTVNKKNLANHKDSTAGITTQDKAFLTSYPEIYGSNSYKYYKGSEELEGNQYPYYEISANRNKCENNNGSGGHRSDTIWWLRSPSSYDSDAWMLVVSDSVVNNNRSEITRGIAPAFCL